MNPVEVIDTLLATDDSVPRDQVVVIGATLFQSHVDIHDDVSLALGLRLVNELWWQGERERAGSLARFLGEAWTEQPTRHAMLTTLADLSAKYPDPGQALLRIAESLLDNGEVTDPVVRAYLTEVANADTARGGEAVLRAETDRILDLAAADALIVLLLAGARRRAAEEDLHARCAALRDAVRLQRTHFGFADSRSFDLVEALTEALADIGQHDQCLRVLHDYEQELGPDDPWPHLVRFQYHVRCFQNGVPGSDADAFVRELRVLRAHRAALGSVHVIRSAIEATLALVRHDIPMAQEHAGFASDLLESTDDDRQLRCLLLLARAKIASASGEDVEPWLTMAADLCDALTATDAVHAIEIHCMMTSAFAHEAVITARDHSYEEAATMADSSARHLLAAARIFDTLPAIRKATAAPFLAHGSLALGRARDDQEYSGEVAAALLRVVREIPASRQGDIAETEVVVAEALLATGAVRAARDMFAKAIPHLERRYGADAPAVRRAVRIQRWPRLHSVGADIRRLMLRERILTVRDIGGAGTHSHASLPDEPAAASIARLVGRLQRHEFRDDWPQAFGRYVTAFLGAAVPFCVVGLPIWLFVLLLPFEYRYVLAVLGLGALITLVLAGVALTDALNRRMRMMLEPDRIRVFGEAAIPARDIVGVGVRWTGLGAQVGVSLANGTHRWLPSPRRYPWLPGNKATFAAQYAELRAWAGRKGRTDGPVPRVPGRLVTTVVLTVLATVTLVFCVSKREVILPWTPLIEATPDACALLTGSGFTATAPVDPRRDNVEQVEVTACEGVTAGGESVRLALARYRHDYVYIGAIGSATVRFHVDQLQADGTSVSVPGASEAYLARSATSVSLSARESNVIIGLLALQGTGRVPLSESRLSSVAATVVAQLEATAS